MQTSDTQPVAAKAGKKKESMNLSKAKLVLEGHQSAFKDVTTQPNTLKRNLVLAEHRTEIERLQKLIAKSSAS